MVEQYVGAFIEEKARLLNLAYKPRILAFLLRLSTFALCRDTSTPMYCQQFGFASMPDLSARDRY